MSPIKKLGLTALAAVMAMAFLGASSANAEGTELCKADENPCGAVNVVEHVHEETLTGEKAKLLSSIGTVECKTLFLGNSLGLGPPLVIHGHFTYSECKRGTEKCTATEVSADSLIEVLSRWAETAQVAGEGEVNVHCGVFMNCTYDGENLAGIAKGPLASTVANGEVVVSEAVTHKVSGLCPETAKLDIVTVPSEAIYISEGITEIMAGAEATALCKVDESPCQETHVFQHIHEETLAGASAVLLSSVGTISCNVLFLGDILGLEGEPLVSHGHFSYSGCNRNGSEGCTVSEVSTDSLLETLKEGHETASVTGEGEFNVHCGAVINCTYSDEGLTATAKGPLLAVSENGEVALSEQSLQEVSGSCPETGKLDITTVPLEAVYISKGITETKGTVQLCKADESLCAKANAIEHVHEETLTGAKAKLISSLGTVECKALFLGNSLGLGSPLVIHGNFTYTECKKAKESCTTTEISTDWLIEVLRTGHETGSVTGEGETNVHCGLFINCTYNGEGLTAIAKGPLLAVSESGEVTTSEQSLHKVSGLCPETGKLDIATVPLEKIYIAK